MAKRLKGQSSREAAAAAKGAKLNYKTGALVKPQLKVATRPKAVSSRQSAINAGASPLPGGGTFSTGLAPQLSTAQQGIQSRLNSSFAASPNYAKQKASFATNQKRTSGNNRAVASKAKSLAPTVKNEMSGTIEQTSGASSLRRSAQGASGGILAGLKGLTGPFGQLLPQDMGATELLGINRAQAKENPQVLGAEDTSPLGQALAQSSMPDIPTGYGDNGATFFNGNDKMGPSINDFIDPNTGRMRADSNQSATSRDSFFSIPTAQAEENGGGNGGRDRSNDNYDINPEDAPQDSQSFSNQLDEGIRNRTQQEINNGLYGGGPGPVDKGGATVGKQYGSGAFGTGKGVQSDDPYIKELRKAYSSNGGEKWLRKQFEELIAQLDPTYAALQKEGTNELNQQLVNQNNQLSSVMNANNTGDSEQRMQLMAQQQRGTQDSISNLLTKLAQSKAQDASGYRSKMNEALASNADKNQTNQQRLMEQIQQYKQQQFNNQPKMTAARAPKTALPPVTSKKTWVDPQTGDIYEYQD